MWSCNFFVFLLFFSIFIEPYINVNESAAGIQITASPNMTGSSQFHNNITATANIAATTKNPTGAKNLILFMISIF